MISVLLAVNWLVVGALSLIRARRHRFNVLDPAWAFLAGYFINYCFKPLWFLFFPEVGLVDGLQPESVFRAALPSVLIFGLFGFVGFIVGDLCCDRLAWKLSLYLPQPRLGRVMPSISYSVITNLLLIGGLVGLWGFIRETGWTDSLLALLTGFQRASFLAPDVIMGHGYYLFAMQLSVFGWALLCAKWFAYPTVAHGWHRIVRISWRFGCGMAALIIWVAFGERSEILAVLFIPFALYITIRSGRTKLAEQRKMLRRAPILVLLFIVVAGPLGLLMKQQEVSVPQMVTMATSAWDSMEFTAEATGHLGIRDMMWGRSYVGDIFYTWYPRALFPNKPERYGIMTVQDLLAPSLMDLPGTFPPGILVEAYINFWYVGLFLVPLFVAVLCRAVYFHLEKNSLFWLVQVALLFSYLAGFRSLGSDAAILTANLVVLGLIISICHLLGGFDVAQAPWTASPDRQRYEGRA